MAPILGNEAASYFQIRGRPLLPSNGDRSFLFNPEYTMKDRETQNSQLGFALLLTSMVLLRPGTGLYAAGGKDKQANEDKAAIQKVLDAQVAAWNKGDLKGFMVGYWNSPDLSFSSGKEKTRGWQATYERYQKRYQSEGQEMGKLSFSELEIEMLSPDSAYVRGRWQLVTSKDKPGGLFTLIFKKLPEGWRIVHDHTSS
jgi:beta-aspartyl-peptidase (threonine type)